MDMMTAALAAKRAAPDAGPPPPSSVQQPVQNPPQSTAPPPIPMSTRPRVAVPPDANAPPDTIAPAPIKPSSKRSVQASSSKSTQEFSSRSVNLASRMADGSRTIASGSKAVRPPPAPQTRVPRKASQSSGQMDTGLDDGDSEPELSDSEVARLEELANGGNEENEIEGVEEGGEDEDGRAHGEDDEGGNGEEYDDDDDDDGLPVEIGPDHDSLDDLDDYTDTAVAPNRAARGYQSHSLTDIQAAARKDIGHCTKSRRALPHKSIEIGPVPQGGWKMGLGISQSQYETINELLDDKVLLQPLWTSPLPLRWARKAREIGRANLSIFYAFLNLHKINSCWREGRRRRTAVERADGVHRASPSRPKCCWPWIPSQALA